MLTHDASGECEPKARSKIELGKIRARGVQHAENGELGVVACRLCRCA